MYRDRQTESLSGGSFRCGAIIIHHSARPFFENHAQWASRESKDKLRLALFFAQNRWHRTVKTAKTQIFLTPLFITTYAISPPKKSPGFRPKRAGPANYEGGRNPPAHLITWERRNEHEDPQLSSLLPTIPYLPRCLQM